MRKTFNQKIFVAVVIITLCIIPTNSFAQSSSGAETPWGGLHLVTLDESICTCSGNSHWILDYKTDSLLMLYYQYGQSRLFMNMNVRATYQLGTYSYAAQPCSINVGESCANLTNMGMYGMMPGTGTSIAKSSEKTGLLFDQYTSATPQGSYLATLKNSSRGITKGFSF